MLARCRVHAGKVQGACWQGAGCMLARCRVRAGKVQGACWQGAGCMHAVVCSFLQLSDLAASGGHLEVEKLVLQ